jgi:adenine-specific DNA-methyltransferase
MAKHTVKMDGNSLSPQKELAQLLKSQFPQIFAEGKVNPDKLKQALGEELDTNNERYGLSWAGKAECFRHIQEMTTATLKPLRSESVDFDKTENIFIEGDNLEVLKVLQRSYYGKIKMIYIDPPYNTGNDSFIYPDRFKEEKDDYELRAGIKDAEGLLTKDGFWRKNSKDAGHFHSNWLSMMYPRLFLAKNLLRDDGVIFVSIDDNEVHNLRMIMDEVFGEENYIECITWNKRIPKNDKGIGNIHEYVLLYAKNATLNHKFVMPKSGLDEINTLLSKLKRSSIPIPEAEIAIRKLYEKKGYDRGITLYNSLNDDYKLWGKINVSWPNANTFGPRYDILHPITKKPTKVPDRGWRWKEGTFDELLDYKNIINLRDGTYICGQIWFDKDENTQPSLVKYLDDVDTLLLRSVISLKSDGGIEVEELFGGKSYYSYPKPTSIIQTFIESFKVSNVDIVLDFFAGSCTTAHAVMALNAEDRGNRKFICVQLAEPCEEESEAFKAGFKTIADIGKERIRRAAKKIKEENKGKLDFDKAKLDLGFKVLKLEQSNFKQWRENVKTGEELKEQMKMFVDNTTKGAASDDMLFEIILKNSRFDLNVKVSKESFDGVDYYRLADGVEIVCLAQKITKKLIDKVLSQKSEKFTCLDIAFKDNDQLKTNTALQMESAKIEFKVI